LELSRGGEKREKEEEEEDVSLFASLMSGICAKKWEKGQRKANKDRRRGILICLERTDIGDRVVDELEGHLIGKKPLLEQLVDSVENPL